MTRIKEDIVREVMTNVDLDKNKARSLVESLLRNVKEALAAGEDVMISGFGNFNIRQKNARMGRNPKTKTAYEISERTVVTFNASNVFRKDLNPD